MLIVERPRVLDQLPKFSSELKKFAINLLNTNKRLIFFLILCKNKEFLINLIISINFFSVTNDKSYHFRESLPITLRLGGQKLTFFYKIYLLYHFCLLLIGYLEIE